MDFLLKIVEGPNKGAEIALVEGLCVTLGKADTCDIILADPTMSDAPLQIEAAADGVSLEMPGEGRSHLELYHAVTVGSTSFAVGSAGVPWPTLVWPKKDEPKSEDEAPSAEPTAEAKAEEKPAEKAADAEKPTKEKKKGGWLIAVIIAVILLLILCALGWIFRDRISALLTHGEQNVGTEEPQISPIDALIARYSLEVAEVDGRKVLKGDFKTRAERLTATAEAYAVQPGIELDFADEDSLKSAVEETLSLIGEKDISVASVDKRSVAFAGKAMNLKRALEAVSADVPKIANVDCSAVTVVGPPLTPEARQEQARRLQAAKHSATVDFPVCGIVTSPYPCLVMRNGLRILEGAAIGENVIVKIEADKVVITNSAGRVVWKP